MFRRKETIMPQGRGSNSLKDPELYEELRKQGDSYRTPPPLRGVVPSGRRAGTPRTTRSAP